jgi:UDP-glucose 4-epimerase
MNKFNIKYIIFSGTCAIFGENDNNYRLDPNSDKVPKNPGSPYGETKLVIENLLKWCDVAYGMKSITLRYFNAAGADESGMIGEDHSNESHLIPNLLKVALGKEKTFKIFGNDYNTKDGTCIRDFIHVTDLSTAHIKSIEYLIKENKSDVFHIGTSNGFSVKEVLDKAIEITKTKIPHKVYPRRDGDREYLVSDSKKCKELLNWTPVHSSLDNIIKTAWKWHKTFRNGYQSMREGNLEEVEKILKEN